MTTETIATRQEQAASRALARSAAYRLLSQITMYPSEHVLTALREEDLPHAAQAADLFSSTVSERMNALREELEGADDGRLQAEHRHIFSHILSLDCPPCETIFTARHVFEETQELGDIAGFYRAFGLELAERERPDHISVELEFLQFLTFKEAYALLNHGPAKARFCRQTQHKFMQDHLGRWAPKFAQVLGTKAGGGYFGSVAALVETVLSEELTFLRANPAAATASPDWREQSPDVNSCPAVDDCPLVEGGLDAPDTH